MINCTMLDFRVLKDGIRSGKSFLTVRLIGLDLLRRVSIGQIIPPTRPILFLVPRAKRETN